MPSSGVLHSGSTIFPNVSGCSYGLTTVRAIDLKSSDRACARACDISSVEVPQLITECAAIRPIWRIPMLTVGIPIDGTSTIPLDELPTTAVMYWSIDKYLNCPSEGNTTYLAGLRFAAFSIISIISFPWVSLLGYEKNTISLGTPFEGLWQDVP